MGSFFLFCVRDPALARAARPARSSAPAGRAGAGSSPAFAGLVHAPLHDVPDPPRRALGRHLHRPEVLARPARRRPRRRAVAVLQHVLITIEWPALILGAIGAVSLWRRKLAASPPSWSGTSSLSLAVYSWAGEKFAWLVLHPLLPVILLAGVGLQAIWETRGALRWVGLVGAAIALVLRRRRLVVDQRRPRRRPARDARLHAVLDRGQGRRRPGPGAGRRAAARASRR